jgi:hypothetical protein
MQTLCQEENEKPALRAGFSLHAVGAGDRIRTGDTLLVKNAGRTLRYCELCDAGWGLSTQGITAHSPTGRASLCFVERLLIVLKVTASHRYGYQTVPS